MLAFNTDDFDKWEERFRSAYRNHKAAGTAFILDFKDYFSGSEAKLIEITELDKGLEPKTRRKFNLSGGILADEIPELGKPRKTTRNITFNQLREWFPDLIEDARYQRTHKIPHSHPKIGQSSWWPELGKLLFATFIKGYSFELQSLLSWEDSNPVESFASPEEEAVIGTEGRVSIVTVNRYERNPEKRAECIRIQGLNCSVCEMAFEQRYGEIGKGFIHVHHLRPLGSVKDGHHVDPTKDLAPVCPNCHAMLHKRQPEPYSVEELRSILYEARGEKHRRIATNPEVRGGKPCIRGTRITVYDVLEYLAGGMTEQEMLEDFPDLTREDILACLAYAADRSR